MIDLLGPAKWLVASMALLSVQVGTPVRGPMTVTPPQDELSVASQSSANDLSLSPSHCEQWTGSVLCRTDHPGPSGWGHCYFSYCDAIADGFVHCKKFTDGTCEPLVAGGTAKAVPTGD